MPGAARSTRHLQEHQIGTGATLHWQGAVWLWSLGSAKVKCRPVSTFLFDLEAAFNGELSRSRIRSSSNQTSLVTTRDKCGYRAWWN